MKSARENAHVKGIVCERARSMFANRNKFHSLHGLKRSRNCGLAPKARYTKRSKLHRSGNDRATARIIVTIMTL